MVDVAVVGAGIVGAACALACARRGLSVVVLERGGLVAGTTGSGEGNLLVSDKPPGPELDLALLSLRLWREWAPELGDIELEAKGGLIVTRSDAALPALSAAARAQAVAGVLAEELDAAAVREREPAIAPDVVGGVYYPQDMQVQPARAAAAMLAAARDLGARVLLRTPAVAVRPDGVDTPTSSVTARWVVNAAGAWAGSLGTALPVAPRRGFVMVTEPVGRLIRHKVYSAEYLDNVASDAASMQTSTVVEGTPAGTVLIGATRELVGFDPALSHDAVGALARGAIALFPALAGVRAIRVYRGYRPFAPDHLPVIGPDPGMPSLLHAHGHEGAGIGLAPATGHLIAQSIVGETPDLDLTPFDPARFLTATPTPLP
ncbi:NAD(P)/FAD-dependent oxidoreductase [Phytohabitans aurantiacus]|uniref:FAD-dependent oxidoreductase n=1 Tax=Phytohabitans aurantiacus TaxID=3016789 RepID=A0ABQ5R5E5_9ACTN|nr:FAD-binding oxidoreductase [Phytohabitans aurantiacus]GLI01145.1 FAD-dependent oxidoreductase [Phytohabitans aurantiacus]